MATSFPGAIDVLTNPTAADTLSSVTVPHATQHADVNDAIEAMQAVIGVTASVVTGSHEYRLNNITTTYSNPLLGTDNESFGLSAGAGLIAGSLRNSFFGKLAGNAATTLDDSVFIGYGAGKLATTAAKECVAIGSNALDAITTGNPDGAVAIGFNSLTNLTVGDKCTAVGYSSLSETAATNACTAIGYRAGANMRGTNLIAIGSDAMLGGGTPASNTASGAIAIGQQAAFALTSSAVIAIGRNSCFSMTSSNDFTTAIGHLSCDAVTSTDVKATCIGYGTFGALTSGANGVAIGYLAADALTTAGDVIAIGSNSMGAASTGGAESIAIGSNALDAVTTTAVKATAIGHNVLTNLTTGRENCAVGHGSMLQTTASEFSTAIGTSSAGNMRGDYNTAIGNTTMFGSGTPANNTGAYNSAIGAGALASLTSGTRNFGGSFNAGDAATTMSDSVCIGYDALGSASTGGGECVAIGNYSLDAVTTTAVKAVAVGFNCLSGLTTGINNCAGGHSALLVASTSPSNTAFGFEAGKAVSTGSGLNTFVGCQSGLLASTGAANVAIGGASLAAATISSSDTAVGYACMERMMPTTGNNAVVGRSALRGSATASNNTGSFNSGVGHGCLGGGSTTSANYNSCLGYSGLKVITSATACIGLGAFAGSAATTAANTCFIGDTTEHASSYAIDTVTIASSNADGAVFDQPHRFSGVMLLQSRVRLCRTTFSNEAKTCPDTTGVLAQVGVLDASRVVTLPAAATYGTGGLLTVVDESGSCSVTNTLVLTRAGADTINGATTNTIVTAYGCRTLVSDGTSKWTLLQSI